MDWTSSMTISDKERREVAKRLRSLAGRYVTLGELEIVLGVDITSPDVNLDRDAKNINRLADLIEPPTCTVRMGVTGHVGVCMRCGAMVEMSTAVFDAIEALPTRYCPNCGTEVKNEVD